MVVRLVSWKVGGEQGQGIDSTGEILARAANRLGYYVYGYKHFSSRIKGGHTNYKLRIGVEPVASTSSDLQILVAIDQETINRNWHELVPGSIVVADPKWEPVLPEECPARLLHLPMSDIAQELGNPLVRNVIALGTSAFLLGMPEDALRDQVRDVFKRHGEKVQELNVEALARGYAAGREAVGSDVPFALAPAEGGPRLLMSGNEAVALGAVVAGCRVVAAYPITPASEILEVLGRYLSKVGGVAVQAEDEISAVMTAIGAGFAGVRALTATSGPGLSLKQEALGLANIAEIPLVIVDCQRGGPSTGMPTKHEQSDLMAMTYGTHGDSPRVIIAPSSPEDAYYDTITAFNLAEQLQMPVYIASDLSVAFNKQTVENLRIPENAIQRGEMVTDDELAKLGRREFHRYEITESGISRRSIPGQRNGQFTATGLEHDPYGEVSENPQNRVAMMNKRFRKVENIWNMDVPTIRYTGPADPEVLLVGFGGSFGAIDVARQQLEKEGMKVGHAHVRLIQPLPAEELAKLAAGARKVIVVENNATGQLAKLIKLSDVYGREDGIPADRLESVLKYDGNPFLPEDIVEEVKEVVLLA